MNQRIVFIAAALLVSPLLAQAEDGRKDSRPAPSQEQRQAMKEKLKNADTNGDKMISREEAKAMPGLEKRFDKLDSNKDGQISKEEMAAARKAHRQDRKQDRKQKADEKFSKADTDKDGVISREEANKGLPKIAKNFDAIDANKDGKASKEEIKAYYQAKMQKMREKKGEKPKS